MAIEPHERPNTSPEDREVLRKVYDDQMRAWRDEHDKAASKEADADIALGKAQEQYDRATRELAVLEGKMDALRMLAARDGVTLD